MSFGTDEVVEVVEISSVFGIVDDEVAFGKQGVKLFRERSGCQKATT